MAKTKSSKTPIPPVVYDVHRDIKKTDEKQRPWLHRQFSFMSYKLDADGEPKAHKRTGEPEVVNYHVPCVLSTQEDLEAFETALEQNSWLLTANKIERLDETDSAYFLKHNKQVDLRQNSGFSSMAQGSVAAPASMVGA